ncbi:M56 family peptidase [Mucilaginibacter terrigena]|uniref:M56 family peptidase n=1 Tax=Mucilaginibacter terrigena TaxID=2492395 RepID=A0A4Q5LQB5_9SPHI|nr:M56 family metallopeptidase [Mucilaginibacter terrigena]RYU91529.1 M56 family peptidase [Mucilaginibacter terrigena]
MPALFVFLFKVNIALLLFCAGYYLVLRHLTFYTLNRAYLMVAILFATLYPKIDLSDFALRHETLAKPVQTVVLNWQAPAQSFIKPLTQPNYWQWATVIFWAGAIFLAFRLLMQLFSLFQLYRRSQPARIHNHDVRLIEGEAAPFSFWRSIYVNPNNHTPADLKAILLHEQVHVNGWHTIDILLAELSSIFYWFNPGIWLMKKAVRENIEFITDRKILNKGFDSKTYQYSLVNVSFNATTPGIVNHFNISIIKKRIIMMNAKRSSRFTLTRYAFVVPAVIALLLVFTLSKADVAKPITHKIAVAIKPVTLAIKEAAKTAMAITDTVPVKKTKPAVAAKKVDGDTIRFNQVFAFSKADTGKVQKFYISTSSNSDIDSMNVVLNGKKISNTKFSQIAPSNILSVNIISADKIKTLLGANPEYTFNNNRHVVFITTKDSKEGNELAEKLGINRQVTNIRIAGGTNDIKALSGTATLLPSLSGVRGTVSNLTVVNGDKLALNEDRLNEVVVQGYGTNTLKFDTAVVVKGYGTANGKQVYVREVPSKRYAVAGNNVTFSPSVTTALRLNTMERISDKLIVIDGKVASESEMKKLSAFDIDRISTSTSADTVKKYGDKAKYGVVYIYTKKGK